MSKNKTKSFASFGGKNQPTLFDSFVDWSQTKQVPNPNQKKKKSKYFNVPIVPWGRDNCYPLFLNTLFVESPSQTGIINGKTFYLTAGGFEIILDDPSDPEQLQKVEQFKQNGTSQYTHSEVKYNTVKDGELYNGFVLHGAWDASGMPRFLEWYDFDSIRTNETKDRFWYSEDWADPIQTFETTKFKEIPTCDLNNRIGEFVIWVVLSGKKTDKKTFNVYPRPPYAGCIKSLMTEVEHESFDLYEVLNSFKTETIVNVPNPDFESEDEKEDFANTIKEGATSRNSAGSVLVLFSEGGTNAQPSVLNLASSNMPDRYLNVSKKTGQTIMIGHSITTPALFGILTEGKLGQQTELETGYEVLKKTFVKSRHQWYDETWTWIIQTLYGIKGKYVSLQPPPLFEKPAEPQSPSVIINNATPLLKPEKNSCFATDDVFLSRDPILKQFEKVGRKKNGYIIAKSFPVPIECNNDWFENSEKELIETFKNERLFFDSYATLLNENQRNVLSLIDTGADPTSVSKELGLSVQEVLNIYNQLSGKGLVKKNGELSEAGKKYLQTTEAPIDRFEIRYSYELRPDVKGPELLPTSRSFCKKLVELDKLYTREEIDKISAAVGRNVWSYRGGWYHNSEEDKNTPYCRHYWVQQLVLKKS